MNSEKDRLMAYRHILRNQLDSVIDAYKDSINGRTKKIKESASNKLWKEASRLMDYIVKDEELHNLFKEAHADPLVAFHGIRNGQADSSVKPLLNLIESKIESL